jgi:hypothetical protein
MILKEAESRAAIQAIARRNLEMVKGKVVPVLN